MVLSYNLMDEDSRGASGTTWIVMKLVWGACACLSTPHVYYGQLCTHL